MGMAAPDSDGYVVLLDSGAYPGYSSVLNQTWVFNSSLDWNNTGATLIDANGPLPVRTQPTMAYDGYQVMMFGGKGDSSLRGVFHDTWLWASGAWTLQSPTTSPVGIFGAKAAFVDGVGTVVFGGENAYGYMTPDTWLWHGDTKNWEPLTTAHSPAGRRFHCMASNNAFAFSVVLLFGGESTNQQFNDTWIFDQTDWVKLGPAHSPSARSNACMAYDPVNAIWVMFGGTNEYGYLNETWVFDGSDWSFVGYNGPSGRAGAQMVYDAQTGKCLLFGGQSATDSYASDETWVFDGSALTWAKL